MLSRLLINVILSYTGWETLLKNFILKGKFRTPGSNLIASPLSDLKSSSFSNLTQYDIGLFVLFDNKMVLITYYPNTHENVSVPFGK